MNITKEELKKIIEEELSDISEPAGEEEDVLAAMDSYFRRINNEELYFKLLMKVLNHLPGKNKSHRYNAMVRIFGASYTNNIIKGLDKQ